MGDAEASSDDIIAALDAQADQIGEMLETRIDEIDRHWRQSGPSRPGSMPKSASSSAGMPPKPKCKPKMPAAPPALEQQPQVARENAADASEGDDLIAALDAQAEEIGNILETRIDQIDTHWRHSGSLKPGVQPKSGVRAKAKPGDGASSLAAAHLGVMNDAVSDGSSLGAVPKAAPPQAGNSSHLGAGAKAAGSSLGACAKALFASMPLPPWRVKKVPAGPPPKAAPESVPIPFKAPPPPGVVQMKSRAAPPPGEVAKEGAEDDEEEYDPFSEKPAPHLVANSRHSIAGLVKAVQADGSQNLANIMAFRNGLSRWVPPASGVTLAQMKGRIVIPPKPKFSGPARNDTHALLAAKQAALEAADAALAGSALLPPPKRRRSATSGPSGGSDVAQAAANWLKPRSGASTKRVDVGAERAKEYFSQVVASAGLVSKEEAPAKRQKVDVFVNSLLEKAPPKVQTCRSLLDFLDKKLASKIDPMAAVGGPKDLKAELEAQASGEGRLATLKTTTGWDARAKRVLDIGEFIASAPGKALLEEAEQKLLAAVPLLQKALKERGEGDLEACIEKRRAWSREAVKRDWFAWCARLLRAKEADLLAAGENPPTSTPAVNGDSSGALRMVDVVQALLSDPEPDAIAVSAPASG